jgi:hypothetical protein
MKIPQPDNSYDAIYEIEATCHAPEPVSTAMPCFGSGGCCLNNVRQHTEVAISCLLYNQVWLVPVFPSTKCFFERLRTNDMCSLCQVNCYRELFRVLKPGGCFAGYEWCMTASFDADNPEHRRIKVRKHLEN